MRKRVMTIVLICSSVLILAGSIIAGITLDHVEERGNTTKVEFKEDQTSQTVEFREMLIHPGDTLEHTMLITNELEGECDLSIDFNEYKPELLANDLQKYVYVTVKLGDFIWCENKLMEDVMGMEFAPQRCTLDADEPIELKISYHMPLETGNEAMHTDAFFDVVLNVSNE